MVRQSKTPHDALRSESAGHHVSYSISVRLSETSTLDRVVAALIQVAQWLFLFRPGRCRSWRGGDPKHKIFRLVQGRIHDCPGSIWKNLRRSDGKNESPLGSRPSGLSKNNPGDFLLSHAVTRAVPSAPTGLTSVFGMGTGVTLSTKSPEK